jgi:hypothetical protein
MRIRGFGKERFKEAWRSRKRTSNSRLPQEDRKSKPTNKKSPSPGAKGIRGTTLISSLQRTLNAVSGKPATVGHHRWSAVLNISRGRSGEFNLMRSATRAGVPLFSHSLADGLLIRQHAYHLKKKPLRCFLGGPGGVRTLGLLNAIEARSQLRYRPNQPIF